MFTFLSYRKPVTRRHDHAIVMISVGRRPWLRISAETFEHYAQRCGADFYLETRLPSRQDFPLPSLPDKPGRKNKAVYAFKSFVAWKYLAQLGYQRLVVVDDSCCVWPTAINVFDQVPAGFCGCNRTHPDHAEDSFRHIRALTVQLSMPALEYNVADYMNSGFMVYDASMAEAFHPQYIVEAAPLLQAAYPHQTLSYFLLKRAGIPVRALPAGFNALPGMKLEKSMRQQLVDIRPYLDPSIHIYHLTNTYRHRARLLQQLGKLSLEAWQRQTEHGDAHFGVPSALG